MNTEKDKRKRSHAKDNECHQKLLKVLLITQYPRLHTHMNHKINPLINVSQIRNSGKVPF